MKKAQAHKKAGIEKRPSEAVYPADILGATDYTMSDFMGRGAWSQSLWHIWREGTDRLSGTIDDFAQLWAATREQTIDAITNMMKTGICDILLDDKVLSGRYMKRFVTGEQRLDKELVTLINRRKQRALRVSKQGRIRVRKHRANKKKQECNAGVTPQKGTSSFSSSFSPSGDDTPVSPHALREIDISCHEDIMNPNLHPPVALGLFIINEPDNETTEAFLFKALGTLGEQTYRSELSTFWAEQKVDRIKHPGKVLVSKFKKLMKGKAA